MKNFSALLSSQDEKFQNGTDAAQAFKQIAVQILENIEEGFFVLDSSWHYIYLNRAAENIYGRPAGDFIGKVLWNELPALRGTEIEENYCRAMAQRMAQQFEAYHGQLQKWLSFKVYPHSDGGMLVFVRDIHESRQLKETVRQSEEKFRIMAETVRAMVFTTDSAGECDYVNQRFLEYCGIPADGMRGKGWKKLVHPEDDPKTGQLWSEALESGQPYENEHRLKNRQGSYRWFQTEARPVRDTQGKIVKWFGCCTEIDDQKQ